MKKLLSILIVAATFISIQAALAAPGDTTQVKDGGANGAFSTIQAAVDATNDGGVVVVHPKDFNVPYIENIVIAKNLTLMCSTADSNFIVDGNIDMTNAADREVTITGVTIEAGHDIGTNGSGLSTSANTAKLNVTNCVLIEGDIRVEYQWLPTNGRRRLTASRTNIFSLRNSFRLPCRCR